MARYGRVVLGGTFDRLHVGHEALLRTAFRAGRRVAIGLTTDAFLAAHPKPSRRKIRTYRARRATLARWLGARFPRSRWTVVPLENRFGRSVEDGVDALVVSADTLEGGRAVNAERRRRGRRAVPLLVVPLVLADDLRPVSARRIRAGEIDRAGHRRSPVRVGVAVEAPEDRKLLRAAVRAAFPRAQITATTYRGSPRQAARRAAVGQELGIALGRPRADGRRGAIAAEGIALPLRPFRGMLRPIAVANALRGVRETNAFNPRRP
ncbi:MAG TPA: pantetheine-phosphate adenylyltransferase [Thermoplasmata archaeon]|nr:pantetheine-phosphate adenylyltransferase [Thermoplasmata archaeon]